MTYVRDAYNSNPTGFATALEVMSSLPGRRRILMTPGMIELGPQQEEQNRKIGHMAAQTCDYTIIVGKTNRKALSEGLIAGGLKSERLIYSETRDNAFSELHALIRDEDIVLIENDLVDLYETTLNF